jgi:hypothetical protein
MLTSRGLQYLDGGGQGREPIGGWMLALGRTVA